VLYFCTEGPRFGEKKGFWRGHPALGRVWEQGTYWDLGQAKPTGFGGRGLARWGEKILTERSNGDQIEKNPEAVLVSWSERRQKGEESDMPLGLQKKNFVWNARLRVVPGNG